MKCLYFAFSSIKLSFKAVTKKMRFTSSLLGSIAQLAVPFNKSLTATHESLQEHVWSSLFSEKQIKFATTNEFLEYLQASYHTHALPHQTQIRVVKSRKHVILLRLEAISNQPTINKHKKHQNKQKLPEQFDQSTANANSSILSLVPF